VPNRALIAINLPIITARVCLVAKEVNLVIDDAATSLLLCNVVQAVCLVPASGEDIKRDLSTNGVCEAGVGEGLLELGDHGRANVVFDVVGLVVIALLDRGVAANGRDVDHAVTEFDKGAALDRNVKVGDVVEDPEVKLVSALTALVDLVPRPLGVGPRHLLPQNSCRRTS
jgi:hypothetical protein